MVRVEEENETMRVCGCHVGRPCTCEMGKQTASTETFSCGFCVNCRLNIRERTRPKKKLSGPRRCLKSAEYFAELAFDRVVLRENRVFRMRKPDWNVDEKTPMYNKLHQMRLAMIQTHTISLATIDTQKKLRTKYSYDLKKTQEAVKNLEKMKMEAQTTRRMTKEQQRVDSDAFDAFSKQLVDAETLLPDLKSRLEKANTTIVTEQRNIKIIREYVRDIAVRKLQASVRAFLRFHRWKKVLKIFQEDAQLSAVLEIQAIWRMFTAKKQKLFLFQLRCDKAKTTAASVIQRFSLKIIKEKHRKEKISTKKVDPVIATRMQKSFETLFTVFDRFVLHNALTTWKDETYKARTHTLRETLASAILIQRIYRGFRDRAYLKRIKIRRSLTDRVGALVDQFIVSGDFWGFVLEIDADYRRFKHKIEEEETDATTFMSTVLRQRKLDEDQMMQDWFTASALQNPLVSGMDQVSNTYSSEHGNSSGSSVPQAMLQSALVEDLVALSPNKRKDDLFPADFPSIVIRQAMAKGFSLDEVIAVMRGLQAQRKDIEDSELVLMTLKKRSPLMTDPWASERVLRETRNLDKIPVISIPLAKANRKTLSKKPEAKDRPNSFISENLLDSIPGGLNAPIARLLLVAALRCYDPRSRGEKGRFVSSDDRNSELFGSYLSTASPLLKIRSEQQAMEAVKPFLHTLLENRCYTAYDVLYNVRGIGELVSWNIPGPLAKNIYSVIEELHVQSSHISKRSIIREVRVSANFERFLKTRDRENLSSSIHSKAGEVDIELAAPQIKSSELSALLEVKSRLETEVLGLPLPDASISASELLFKAAFLVSGCVEDSTTTDAYLRFLQTLLRLQTDGETEALKQLIAARVAGAKTIADQHTGNFRLFAVETAHDIMKNNLIPVLIRDEALQQKVTELLEPFGASDRHAPLQLKELITRSPRSTKLTSLSPLIWQGKTAHDSLDKSAHNIGFSCRAPASSREMLPRS